MLQEDGEGSGRSMSVELDQDEATQCVTPALKRVTSEQWPQRESQARPFSLCWPPGSEEELLSPLRRVWAQEREGVVRAPCHVLTGTRGKLLNNPFSN